LNFEHLNPPSLRFGAASPPRIEKDEEAEAEAEEDSYQLLTTNY